jgi:hypothetical protein
MAPAGSSSLTSARLSRPKNRPDEVDRRNNREWEGQVISLVRFARLAAVEAVTFETELSS